MGDLLKDLSINPCKMCMPMGSAAAFCGIKGAMNILHGSQGCATYIRRHMATHYNEPVDIASSSLTEDGTVFGGEKNLIKGLDNLIKLYNPRVIGVSSTCLAETIGEDIIKMVQEYISARKDIKTRIITVSAAGYAGSQYEGFFKASRAIVEQLVKPAPKNGKINIITGIISPADTRFIKELLNEMKVDFTLLTDISDNMDGGYEKDYSRLSKYGTDIDDIAAMSGAKLTIELSTFIKDEQSPGLYLQENFGVELKRLNLPIGLRDTDAFIETLIKAGGALTERLQRQRSRYLDAMADSHKYNSDARAAIFGEPDFVFSMCRLLSENGAFTALAATGSECKGFESAIQSEVEANKSYYLNEEPVIIDEADFSDIENLLKEKGVNLLVGSSDARRLEQTYHIPLVRAAFPVHDHVGGQRVRTLGYEGSLTLLDRITNSLLSATEHTYRAELYNSYYPAKLTKNTENPKASGSSLSAIHPCFNGCGSNYARLHLPVAKRCNIKCNYCLRKYDCPNESRPGITSRVLSPEEALDRYLTARDKVDNLTVVGIAGPGDALADFEKTKRTLTLIREIDENIVFCISTNGLFLPYYADELAKLRATHITVTVNAVEPAIGAKIYENVAFMGASYHGETGAALLMANQFAGISRLKELGIVCKVNTVVLKGINDEHIPAVAKKVRELGAELQNIMQLIPVKGSAFENTPLVSNMEILKLRKVCSAAIPQMNHCRQCRADALGTLDNDISRTFWWSEELEKEAAEDAFESHELLLFAVSSKGGVLVDQHFGHTEEFYIYEYNRSEVRFREKRSVYKYCGGKTDCDDQEDKINLILNALDGCKYLLCMRIGENPKRRLEQMGIQTFITYDRIESAVKEAVKTIGGVERKALCRVGDQK